MGLPRYWGVFWIDCSSHANAEASYALLSERAGKGHETGAGQEWLSQTVEPWLLVLDNANNPEMDLNSFLPVYGNGHILITTRNPNARIYNNVDCGPFHFRGMDPEEAIMLLLKLAYPDTEQGSGNYNHARDIASELGYLALALKQAAYTIRHRLLPLERYLRSLLGCRKELLSSSMVQSSTDANIVATYELPFKEIAAGSTVAYRDAVDLLQLIAFMHFSGVPEPLFARSSDNFKRNPLTETQPLALTEPTSIQAVADRILAAAKVLYDHSLIAISRADTDDANSTWSSKPSMQLFSLHPAIHQWARERMDKAEQARWLICAASILAHSISLEVETSGRPFRRLLLSHIESCLAGLDAVYPGFPESLEHCSIIEKFALVFDENGLFRRARSLLLRVVEFRRTSLGKRHADTIRAQRALANTYWTLFEIAKCLEVQKEILDTLRWTRPSLRDWMVWPPWKPTHITYCIALDDIARFLWLGGRRELAHMAGTRALDGLTQKLGVDDPITIDAMFNLGRTNLHLGKLKESQELLEVVEQKRRHFFGPDHPETLMAMNELGMNLSAQGVQLDYAESLVSTVWSTRKKVLGEEHPYTLWSANDLSRIYCELGRFQDALLILEEIVPIIRRTLGEDHIGMNMTKANLSRTYILCKRWEEAASILAPLCETVDSTTPDWIHACYGYALVLVRMEDFAKAEIYCNQIMAKIEETKVIAPDSARALATVDILFDIYQAQDRAQELEDLKARYPHITEAAPERHRSIDIMPLKPARRSNANNIDT